jgi:SAM-dependent methyltransferase
MTQAIPDWLREEIRTYYTETTEQSYLAWGGNTFAMHIGLSPAVRRDDFRATLLATNAFLADKAGITTGTRVLDAGCGMGGSSVWLAAERGAEVVGITIAPNQVALANRLAHWRGVRTVSFACMDFNATTFEPGSFDVVWNLESFCHVLDHERYLAHVMSLLRPGGRFVCLDFFRGDGGDPRQCDAMCDGWVLPNLQRPAAIADLLLAQGYDDVEMIDVTDQTVVSGLTLRVSAAKSLEDLRASVSVGASAGAGAGAGSASVGAAEGVPASVLERHYEAAIGAGEGLESGSIVYTYVGGRRPAAGSSGKS